MSRLVPDHASGPAAVARTRQYWLADPDETEGRRIYRALADKNARHDEAMLHHKPRYKRTKGEA